MGYIFAILNNYMKKRIVIAILLINVFILVQAQTKKTVTTNEKKSNRADLLDGVAISDADPGVFPFFTTPPNFYPRNAGEDSVTFELNEVYMYDGAKVFTVVGKTSAQKLNVINNKKPFAKQFQLRQNYEKIITTLGGKKIFSGVIPEAALKAASGGKTVVDLSSKNNLVGSGWYPIDEYVLKTKDREIWVQLVTETIGSDFYQILIVEKDIAPIPANTNKNNAILTALSSTAGKAVVPVQFIADSSSLASSSKDVLLSIVGVLQAHPDWKLNINVYNAAVGKQEYTLDLTQKRAIAISSELLQLGIKPASVNITGKGDENPVGSNNTEKGRIENTRLEIMK